MVKSFKLKFTIFCAADRRSLCNYSSSVFLNHDANFVAILQMIKSTNFKLLEILKEEY